ncbi:unnamed protein product [Adineta steineri]|uniref:Uncharacterized protein n=1 Tax=Adineta steineri TaxID=433720 RepID=A0A815BX78_9BILA|nr:unnamed protein product [Adineta steineri]
MKLFMSVIIPAILISIDPMRVCPSCDSLKLSFDSIKIEHINKLQSEFNQTKQFISIVLKPFLPRMIDSPLRALACALQDDFYSNV